MKHKRLLFSIILLTLLLLFGLYVLRPVSPSVEVIDDTLTYQIKITEQLTNEIENGNYTFDEPFTKVNPYGISPLTALIAFSTSEQTAITLTVNGKDPSSTFSQTFPASTQHVIPVYGLYADTENEVTLKMEKSGEIKTLPLQTSPLPEDFILPTDVTVNADYIDQELYFYTPSSDGYTAAYDLNGDVRWYLTTSNVWEINRLQNGHLILSSDRTVSPPYYMAGLMEMDLLGKVYTEYVFPGGYHHDVYELPSGNLLIAGNNPSKSVVEDYVLEIDRQTGEVVKEWDVSSVLPTTAGKSENWTEHDWFHNNSVYYDEINNAIILSGRHQDAVISVDYESGDLNWIIGDSTNWPDEIKSYFFTPIGDSFEWQWSQHSAKVLPNGDIFIFDNGNNRSKDPLTYVEAQNNYSRGVIYRPNTEKMTIEQIYEYGKELGADFYSPYISEVDYLDENHYLIHSGGIGEVNGIAANQPAYFYDQATLSSKTVELVNNEVIATLEFPAHLYRVQKMSLYTDNPTFSLDPGQRLGTLGETPTLKLKVKNLFFNRQPVDDVYQLHLTQESDRLILTGIFHERQKVKLILSQWNDQRVYDIRVTSTPYSAMCIDLFDKDLVLENDQISMTKYINAEGLNGTYQLYIEIDGEVYNIFQSVNFD